jgi:Asp-tRNA(Asn)/Glu-tRNA(Gln) amidotransferase A subunit family amidase
MNSQTNQGLSPPNRQGTQNVCTGIGVSGLPVSMQLIARPFMEATLFQAGHAYEMAVGTRKRRPMMAMVEAAE